MRTITKIFIAGLLVLSINNSLSAKADSALFIQMVNKVNKAYLNAYPFKNVVQYSYYEALGKAAQGSMQCTIISDGRNQFMVADGYESLTSDSFNVMINHEEKLVSVEKKITTPGESPWKLDSLYNYLGKVTRITAAETEKWSVQLLECYYKRMEIDLETKTGFVKSIRFFVSDDVEGGDYKGAYIEVKIISRTPNYSQSSRQMDPKNFFLIGPGNTVKLIGTIKDYHLLTPKLD